MDLQSIMQSDKKKKIVIIGVIILLIILGLIFIFTRKNTSQENQYGQNGQTQLLTDIAQLEPRDSLSQSEARLVAPIITVSTDTPTIAPGQPAVISWKSANATSCVDSKGNELHVNGSISITPAENYTMDVVCTNPKGTTIESVTVAVTTSPIITLSAYPQAVKSGEQSFISWSTINTTRCTDDAGKTLRLSDGFSVVVKKPYTFKINCTGPNGTGKQSVTIAIASPQTGVWANTGTGSGAGGGAGTNTGTGSGAGGGAGTNTGTGSGAGGGAGTNTGTGSGGGSGGGGGAGQGPSITFSASPTTVASGDKSTLSWTISNFYYCSSYGSDSSGNLPRVISTSGSQQTSPLSATQVYKIACIGPGGPTSKSVVVEVEGGLPTFTVSRSSPTLHQGQSSYDVWSTTNATSLSYNCSGFGSPTVWMPTLQGSGTWTWEARWNAGWHGPYNCTWKVTGPKGTVTYANIDNFNIVPPSTSGNQTPTTTTAVTQPPAVVVHALNPIIFSTAGAHSWTAPAGVTSITVMIVAGGGGGGGPYCYQNPSQCDGGDGGNTVAFGNTVYGGKHGYGGGYYGNLGRGGVGGSGGTGADVSSGIDGVANGGSGGASNCGTTIGNLASLGGCAGGKGGDSNIGTHTDPEFGTSASNIGGVGIPAVGVGGGGGGGYYPDSGGGGGGGGGSSFFTAPVVPGTAYQIVVGGGGNAAKSELFPLMLTSISNFAGGKGAAGVVYINY